MTVKLPEDCLPSLYPLHFENVHSREQAPCFDFRGNLCNLLGFEDLVIFFQCVCARFCFVVKNTDYNYKLCFIAI